MRTIRLFERGAHWLASRQRDRSEIALTVGDVCRAAYARGGWLMLIRAGLAEWINILCAALAPGPGRLSSLVHRSFHRSSPPPPRLFMRQIAQDVRHARRALAAAGGQTASELVAQRFADAIARPRIVFVMMTVFSIFGLVLAAAGLYAVLAYLVAQRQREIGIRFALGARPRDVRRLVLGSALTICTVGVVLGFAASAGLVRTMQTLVYEIEPFDLWSLTAVMSLMMAAAVLACWRPVRRALRVDPVTLLRES